MIVDQTRLLVILQIKALRKRTTDATIKDPLLRTQFPLFKPVLNEN